MIMLILDATLISHIRRAKFVANKAPLHCPLYQAQATFDFGRICLSPLQPAARRSNAMSNGQAAILILVDGDAQKFCACLNSAHAQLCHFGILLFINGFGMFAKCPKLLNMLRRPVSYV